MANYLEILSVLIGLLGPAIAALWYWYTKTKHARLEAELDEHKKLLDSNLAARADEREFTQEQQKEIQKYQQLQDSWRADANMELLRESLDFIKNVLLDRIDNMESRLRRLEQTSADSRGTLEILTRTISRLIDTINQFKTELIYVIRQKL